MCIYTNIYTLTIYLYLDIGLHAAAGAGVLARLEHFEAAVNALEDRVAESRLAADYLIAGWSCLLPHSLVASLPKLEQRRSNLQPGPQCPGRQLQSTALSSRAFLCNELGEFFEPSIAMAVVCVRALPEYCWSLLPPDRHTGSPCAEQKADEEE